MNICNHAYATETCRLSILEEYDIAHAQQESLLVAGGLGLCRLDAYTVATAVTELASNLVRHAHGGTLTLHTCVESDAIHVEVVTDDEGPGIQNVEDALKDGFSTGNSLGYGLPGVQRLMDQLEIASEVGRGTHIVARKRIPIVRAANATRTTRIPAHPTNCL